MLAVYISSHQSIRASRAKMRFLIVSAFLTVAAAAPSGPIAPVEVPVVKTEAVPAAIPTISPGDIYAAAIDARTVALDQLQAAADKAREIAEQATENDNEKVSKDTTLDQARNLEAFWSTEDKKWQAVDALKTAEAQIDGAVASNANRLAKSYVNGAVIPYVAAVGPISPIFGQILPVVYIAPSGFPSQALISNQVIKPEITEENKVVAVKAVESALNKEVAVKADEPVLNKEIVVKTDNSAMKFAENLLTPQPWLSNFIGLPGVLANNVPAVGQSTVKNATPGQ